MKTLFELPAKKVEIKIRKKDWVFDICDALQSSIVMYPSPWQASCPRQMIEIIPMERMKALANAEYTATIVECAVYLYPASLEAPLDHDWAEIYLYCCTQYIKTWRRDTMLPADICVEQLSNYRKGMLMRLRRWIYDKRRKHLKLRMREQKKKLSQNADVAADPIEHIQLNMFEELSKGA